MPSSLPVLAIAWIDDYHVGDPLFVQGLGRGLGARGAELRRAILVHGGSERAERLLEARTLPFEVAGGVPVSTSPVSRGIIERAFRETNKEIVEVLTEFGVPTVGIQGADRRLLTLQEDRLEAARAGWLETLTAAGTVAVVSALADSAGVVHAVATARAVEAVSRAIDAFEPEIRIFRGNTREIEKMEAPVRLAAIASALPEGDLSVLRTLLLDGFRVTLCDARTVFDPDPTVRTPIFG